MSKIYTILLMVFCHIADDFYLQGILGTLKQKAWWEENAPKLLYKNDYLCALFIHAFSWSFMIMLPIAFAMNFNITSRWFGMFAVNVVAHAMVDNEKCNLFTINLCTDQILHLVQIIWTAMVLL